MIGIIGTHKGAGTTHFAVMLAVFLGIIRGEKVALVEMNARGCFRQAKIIRSKLDAHKNKIFYKKISIFEQSEFSDLAKLVSEDYSYIIVDFGSNYNEVREPFLLCNIKIVVGSLSWWKLQHYVAFLAKVESERLGRFQLYLANCCTDGGKKYIVNKFNIRLRAIPYAPDPYCLGDKELDFLHSMTELW